MNRGGTEMSEQTAVEGTQVERLQASLKEFVAERDYFEKSKNEYYDMWQSARATITELEKDVELAHNCNKTLFEQFERIRGLQGETNREKVWYQRYAAFLRSVIRSGETLPDDYTMYDFKEKAGEKG